MTRQITLGFDGTTFYFDVMVAEESCRVVISPEQLFEASQGEEVTAQDSQCTCRLTTRAGILELYTSGHVEATFDMPLRQFQLLAKGLGLKPPT